MLLMHQTSRSLPSIIQSLTDREINERTQPTSRYFSLIPCVDTEYLFLYHAIRVPDTLCLGIHRSHHSRRVISSQTSDIYRRLEAEL